MLSFFKLSRKKKEKLEITISKYVMSINDVIDSGFIEIKEFINENNNLDISPEIKDDDIRWFRIIIILGNISELKNYFEESQVSKMKDMIIEDSLSYFNKNSSNSLPLPLPSEAKMWRVVRSPGPQRTVIPPLQWANSSSRQTLGIVSRSGAVRKTSP